MEIKQKILKKLKELPHFDKLQFIYLYGSQATGKTSKKSDIDICLHYDIQDEKTLRKLGYKIQGNFTQKYDIAMFQQLPLPVQREVFKGKPLYLKDKNSTIDLALETSRKYKDFQKRHEYILNHKAGTGEAEL